MSRTATRKKEKWLLEWITEKLMKGGEFFSGRNNDDGMWQKKCRFAGYLSSNHFEYNDQKKSKGGLLGSFECIRNTIRKENWKLEKTCLAITPFIFKIRTGLHQ